MMVVSTSKLFLLALFSVAGIANGKLIFYLSKLRCHLEYCCQKFTSLIELCLHRKRNMEGNWRGGA